MIKVKQGPSYISHFFNRQNFYTQHQAETGKKVCKSQTMSWGWTLDNVQKTNLSVSTRSYDYLQW